MGIFSSLFGSNEVLEKGATGIIDGVDKIFYTSEEKADNFTRMLALYEPFKIAQRLLALTFCIPYVFAWLATFIASFFMSVEAQTLILSGTVGYVVLTIAGFYFGGGALEGFVKAARKK